MMTDLTPAEGTSDASAEIIAAAESGDDPSKQVANTVRPRPPNAGKGRPPGSLNKTTAVAREVFRTFLESNADRVQQLFDRVCADDPKAALQWLATIAEYVVPRLARTEIEGELSVRRGDPADVPDFSKLSPNECARVYMQFMRDS